MSDWVAVREKEIMRAAAKTILVLWFGISSINLSATELNSCNFLDLQRWNETENAQSTASEHIFIHQILRDLVAINSFGAKVNITSEGYAPRGVSANYGSMAWIRDRYPLWGRYQSAEGNRDIMLIYTNPFSESPHPSTGSAEYIPSVPPAGVPSNTVAVRLSGSTRFVSQRYFPGILEGGNLLWTSHHNNSYIFTSVKTVELNRWISESTTQAFQQQLAKRFEGSGFKAGNWQREFLQIIRERGHKLAAREQTQADIAGNLSMATSVPTERIIFTEWMPGEKTGHVDIWLGTLRGNLLAVPYIPKKLIDGLGYEHERNFSTGINLWLDRQADMLSNLAGVRVIRLPMLPPKNLQSSTVSPLGYDATFLSPVNFSVRSNRVLIPEHRGWMDRLAPSDQATVRNEISEKLSSLGFEIEFVNAEKIMDKSGGLHCVTADYPNFEP
jgi:hypothetical protein